MAKSLRASGKKTNRQNLRARVFGPAETARLERLAALQKTRAEEPKPARPEMEIDTAAKSDSTVEDPKQVDEATAMDVDGETAKTSSSSSKAAKPGRIEKRSRPTRRQKPRNAIVFPKFDRKKNKLTNKNKK